MGFWRSLLFAAAIFSCNSQVSAQANKWVTIFNGKDLSGWIAKISGQPLGKDKLETFRVESGKLLVSYQNYQNFDLQFGHLFYHEKLSHYRLRLEYRFVGEQLADAPNWAYRNSGVMLHSQHFSQLSLNQAFPLSVEAQFLGADTGTKSTTGNLCTPGTHVRINEQLVTQHCINSSSHSYPGSQWVKAELEVRGDQLIRHWINDIMVLEYKQITLDETDPVAKQLIQQGAKRNWGAGYIALQSESHPIEFRNIELMRLNP